jgi:hypothetical protein
MKLIIQKEVLDYVASKNETVITLDLFIASGCCVPLSETNVYLGMPKDPLHKYDLIEQDGLKIYVFKGAKAKNDTMTLKLKKFLGTKGIEAEGFALI